MELFKLQLGMETAALQAWCSTLPTETENFCPQEFGHKFSICYGGNGN